MELQPHRLQLIRPNNCKIPENQLDKPFHNITAYDDCFKTAGKENNIDWHLLKAIAITESKLEPRAKSQDGQAIGLMQVRAGNLTGDDWRKLGASDTGNKTVYDGLATVADRYKHSIYTTEWFPYMVNFLYNGCFNINAGTLIYKNALSIAKGNWSEAISIYNVGRVYYTNRAKSIQGYQYSVQVLKNLELVSTQI